MMGCRKKIWDVQDKTVLQIIWPIFCCHGMNVGETYSTWEGRGGITYSAHKIKARIDMGKCIKENNPSKKYTYKENKERKDVFSGVIYNYNPEKSKKMSSDYKNAKECFENKDEVKVLSTFIGSVFETLEFDGKDYVDMRTSIPQNVYYEEIALPSDCRFREDMIWHLYED